MSKTSQRRTYKNPPITEAVCAIHFAPGGDWNFTFPALLYEKIRDEYQGKPREQKLVNIEANPKEASVKGAGGMAVNEITRVQFISSDERKIISLYEDDLAVSVVRPYPGWEVFRASIERGFEAYKSIVHPSGIRRIGLRYINQIEVNGSVPELLKCLSQPPSSLENTNTRLENFAWRSEYVYEDEPIKVAVTLARLLGPTDKTVALFDIDLILEWPAEPLSVEQAMSRVDDLRTRERLVFESLVTDKAREVFDA